MWGNEKFNQKALFSDESGNYRKPAEPDRGERVEIKFRTARNDVDLVYLICGNQKTAMEKTYSKDMFDYYVCALGPLEGPVHYFFEIIAGNQRCFYNKLGVTEDLQEAYAFRILPDFHTPDWAKGAVMYQIFTDRFRNGETSNDVEDREYFYTGRYVHKVKDWEKLPDAYDVHTFYGGDLPGVREKLDYLQELGIEVLYLNPIFVSPSNHKYDTQDYDYIDPHLTAIAEDGGECLTEGDLDNSHAAKYRKRVVDKKNLDASNAYFAEFVKELHARGMRIILDGVFNHCGSFNKWLDRECLYEGDGTYEKGAYVSASSPYRDFFKFNNEHEWPYNPYYDGWWGHDTLPKLNYEQSPNLREYILHIAEKWLKPPYSVDGWRLDVAADLGYSEAYNHDFWRAFRQRVKKTNPEALILAEHYGDCSAWLQGDQWDSVMNYDAFMEPITWFLTGMEKHSDDRRDDLYGNAGAFQDAMLRNMARFCEPSLETAMNELSNHDHSRFLTRTNRKVGRIHTLGAAEASEGIRKGVMKEAVVFQMTWVGCPTVYYGDEAGLCGFTDPDNRRTYPWGREDQDLLAFHREMIRIRKEHPVLRYGSTRFLTMEEQFISYGRFDGRETLLVLMNNAQEERRVEIPVWMAEVPEEAKLECLMETSETGYSTKNDRYPVRNGILSLTVPGVCGMVLHTCSCIG